MTLYSSVSVKKMNPHLFPSSGLFFLIVILSQVPTFWCADDKQYTNCTQLFQCANIPNLSYPFWGGNRPDYCSHPSFKLNCQGDAPLITIQTRPHRVLAIDNTAQILTAVRAKFWNNSCPAELHNANLDTAHFNYSSNTQDPMLYVNGTNNTVGFVVNSVTTTTKVNILTCQVRVRVRVNQRAAQALENSTSNVTQVLDTGFGLQWRANNTDCNQCVGSGGICKSNSTSGSFVCYCSDQPYAITCRTAFSVIVALAVMFLITIIFYDKRQFTSSANVVAFWKKETVDDQNVKAFIKNHRSLAPKRYRGTVGYIAPEVFSRTFGQVSYKSDVYSYGMMVLEMTGAKDQEVKAVETSEKYFPHWIYEHLEHDKDLRLHGVVTTREEEETVRKMILVGLWCIRTNPSDRPPMSKVVEMLEGSFKSLQIPPKPFLFSTAISDPSAQDTSNSLWTLNMVKNMSEGSLQSMQISAMPLLFSTARSNQLA
ncbi:unnamed protein product [Camellia sinensis]